MPTELQPGHALADFAPRSPDHKGESAAFSATPDAPGVDKPKTPGASAAATPALALVPVTDAITTPVHPLELLIGALALAAWFILFAGGILVGTEFHRQRLLAPGGFSAFLSSSLIVLFFWTITNVGILSCLSAFIGALGRRTRFAARLVEADAYADLLPASNPRRISIHYASAIIRGFTVYGLLMAGLLVLATDTFTNPSQGEYLRISATVCLMAFYAGYDPELFATLLERVKRLVGDSRAADGKR